MKITYSRTVQIRRYPDFTHPEYDGNLMPWMCKEDLLEVLVLYSNGALVACKWKHHGFTHVSLTKEVEPEKLETAEEIDANEAAIKDKFLVEIAAISKKSGIDSSVLSGLIFWLFPKDEFGDDETYECVFVPESLGGYIEVKPGSWLEDDLKEVAPSTIVVWTREDDLGEENIHLTQGQTDLGDIEEAIYLSEPNPALEENGLILLFEKGKCPLEWANGYR